MAALLSFKAEVLRLPSIEQPYQLLNNTTGTMLYLSVAAPSPYRTYVGEA